MDRQRILVAAGSILAFAAFVATGAFVIVSLAPPERPVTAAKGALLMETASAPRAFDEAPARPARPNGQSAAPPPMAPPDIALAERGPEDPTLSEAQALPKTPPAAPAPPPAPAHRAPRTTLAALPQAPLSQPPLTPATSPPVAAAPPVIVPKPAPRAERRPDGVLTPTEIRRFRLSLRLTREQEPYWPPVEQVLADIGAQQAAMVRAGQDPKDVFGVGSAMRVYGVARPLLDVLREDQKAKVREQARSMGFGSIASSI